MGLELSFITAKLVKINYFSNFNSNIFYLLQ